MLKNLCFILIVMLTGLIFTSCKKNTLSFVDAVEKCKNIPTTSFLPTTPTCLIGAALPDFKTKTIDGKIIDQTYFIDKINIINFWFETCPPCVAEIPGLNRVKETFGTGEINYLAIGIDRWDHIKEFTLRQPFDFDLVANGRSIYRDTFHSIWGYPFTLITDTEGIVIDAFVGNTSDSTAETHIFDRINKNLQAELNL